MHVMLNAPKTEVMMLTVDFQSVVLLLCSVLGTMLLKAILWRWHVRKHLHSIWWYWHRWHCGGV